MQITTVAVDLVQDAFELAFADAQTTHDLLNDLDHGNGHGPEAGNAGISS